MKTLLVALAASAALFASPAAAQVVPYGELTATNSEFRIDGTTLGGRIGVESPLGKNLSATTDIGYDLDRAVSANIGLVGRLNSPVSLYGQIGLLRDNGDFGYRVGGGVKVDLNRHSYVRAGYQRDDYGPGSSDAGTVALGIRF